MIVYLRAQRPKSGACQRLHIHRNTLDHCPAPAGGAGGDRLGAGRAADGVYLNCGRSAVWRADFDPLILHNV